MINKPDFSAMSDPEKDAWQAGYNFSRIELQKKLDQKDESIGRILAFQDRESRRWRDAGITYESVRDVLNMYQREEISFGKLVEELRGLAAEALKKIVGE